jgi:hypothetical protein
MSPVLSSNFFINLDTQLFNNVINVATTSNLSINNSNSNPLLNLFSNGVSNVISNPNPAPAILINNTEPTKIEEPIDTNISIVKPLIQHLLSTNFISIHDLKLIIDTL